LADIPKTLAAKQRIVIPYRVTATKLHPKSMGFSGKRASEQSELQQQISKAVTAKASSCSSYANFATTTCGWVCANGEMESSSATSTTLC